MAAVPEEAAATLTREKAAALVALAQAWKPREVVVMKGHAKVWVRRIGDLTNVLETRKGELVPDGYVAEKFADDQNWVSTVRIMAGCPRFQFALRDDPDVCSDWEKTATEAYKGAAVQVLGETKTKDKNWVQGVNGRNYSGVFCDEVQAFLRKHCVPVKQTYEAPKRKATTTTMAKKRAAAQPQAPPQRKRARTQDENQTVEVEEEEEEEDDDDDDVWEPKKPKQASMMAYIVASPAPVTITPLSPFAVPMDVEDYQYLDLVTEDQAFDNVLALV